MIFLPYSTLSPGPAQVEYLRNYERLQDKTYTRLHPVKYAPGTTSESPASSTLACMRLRTKLHASVCFNTRHICSHEVH